MAFCINSNDRDRDLSTNVRINPEKLKEEYGIDPNEIALFSIILLIVIPLLILAFPFFF